MKKNATKSALLMSVVSLMLCFTMLLGTTFAWFTDNAASTGNKIQSGTLKIDLELLGAGGYTSVRGMTDPIFNYDKWEPGYTVVKTMKIANEGSLALKYQLNVTASPVDTAEKKNSSLANVIDVYMCFGESTAVKAADLADTTKWWKCGTLAEMMAKPEGFTQGKLLPVGADTTGITLGGENGIVVGEVIASVALHMQETAGNEYQDLDLGGIDINLLATQFTYEEDTFDDQYDKDTTLDFTPVSNINELKAALAAKKENILLTQNMETAEPLVVDYDAVIDGAGKTISRAAGYTGTVFTVNTDASLTIDNTVIDGGAVWSNTLAGTGSAVNNGVTATGNLIAAGNNASIVLNAGAVLQNNDGAHAVNLGTRIGATLTLNGGEIIYNRSDSGAVWGGGHITVNSGKISYNTSTSFAGAIRMVSNCNLTMNGGEISYNTAAANGGAIYGYGASTYNFNGGSISNNTAAVGGAMYTGDSSTVNISGTFEMCNNTAGDAGALRLSNRTGFNMSGGEISGNVSTNSPAWNGFYGWNPGVTLAGGTLADDITIQGGLTPTVGGGSVTGTIHFALSTNHNTANLVKDFGTFKFTVAEGTNFNAFNLKPAADYVYTAGDEAKLVCLNNGYTTYWNAEKGAFCLKAV